MNLWWLAPLVLLFSLVLVAGMRRYAFARDLLDKPNPRSSHLIPTPRGGGIAIIASFLLAVVVGGFLGAWSWRLVGCLLGSGLIIGGIGFLDDHGHIAARWRLLAHFLAAVWILAFLDGAPPLALPNGPVDMSWFGFVLASFYLVWLVNLYNFMDGIDGIASVEAITACLGGAFIYYLSDQPNLVLLPLILAAAVGGFLYWNTPPARIFMGDAGSGFLGITLGAFSLQAAWISPHLFWAWLILLGVFVTDATLTLFRRLLRGEKVHEAHRSHAYQHAALKFGAHGPVTLAVAIVNAFWLLPIAVLVAANKVNTILGLLAAYLPLVWIALKLHAGGSPAQRRDCPPPS